MNILFICKRSSAGIISPAVISQAKSLEQIGCEIDFFCIKSYLHAIFLLQKKINIHSYDILHAHYGLSGFITCLASFRKSPRVVVTFMGMDVMALSKGSIFQKTLYWFVNKISILTSKMANMSIVMTPHMKSILKNSKSVILSNGVNQGAFHPIPKLLARSKLGLANELKLILFAGSPSRNEKNYALFLSAIKLLNFTDNNILVLRDIPHDLMPYYFNAVDITVLCSTQEGSPNVIKEAMSCNCPIVSTNVGNVEQLFGGISGCFLSDSTPESLSKKILVGLNYPGKTDGDKRIRFLGLDSEAIAKKIKTIYQNLMI